ncbi:MAG TPA: DNA polymerase IV [Chitinophaga sp.]|uniref:DNA polymerase IV n=1 Tax=Chitinophaga sp. TaxID=1869181 RepID=UPI002CAFC703|nr:DNA polymerase IV [Chitinophaga sp.]HVI46808.1 DNA polymerase IV [Chitinophaga sp.]
MDRHIVHLDLDTFFVSVERLRNRNLVGKPVLIGGSGDRAVVASCSYEARRFGIHSAMPMAQARKLCPEAIIIRGDVDQYERKSREVTQIISEKAPIVEKASIDEHYLDLSGMDRFFGCQQFTDELRGRIIKETGLPISYGLSINKTVSKIATGIAKPNGARTVPDGTEKPFLAPLSVRKIPGVGDKTYRELCNLGVQLIHTLQQMDSTLLYNAFGEHGTTIWQRANAVDEAPVVPYREEKSINREQTFGQDTTDQQLLRRTLIGMVTELAFELRSHNRLASCVTVKIRYSDWNTYTQQMHIPHSNMDHVLTEKALDLFHKLNQRRQLIRLVGVKLSDFATGSYQVNLFSDTAENISLYQALDSIRSKFGPKAITKAISL